MEMSKEKLDSILESKMTELIKAIKGRHYDDEMEEQEYRRKVVSKMYDLLNGYNEWISLCED